MDIIPHEQNAIEKSSFKKYYGYVIGLSRERLDKYRLSQNILHDEFIEILVTFIDERKTIKMSYYEFKKRME